MRPTDHQISIRLFPRFTTHGRARSVALPRTNRIERVLLLLTIAVTPLLDTLPPLGEFSMAWLWFAVIGAYVLFQRANAFERTLLQPAFLAAYAFIATGVMMEVLHTNPDFRDLIRFIQTVGGAVIIATLCRDRQAMRSGLYGFLLLGGLLTAVLLATSYRDLRGANVKGFDQASRLRGDVYRSEGSEDLLRDLNRISFLCGLGAIVAMGFAAKLRRSRLLWFGMTIVMLLGALLPLSRSGVLIVGLAGLAILLSSSGRRLESVLIAVLIVGCLYAIAPAAVFERFKTLDERPGTSDPRQVIFKGVLEALPEFWLAGVGTSEYWSGWAVKQGIATRAHKPLGAHNSFFQVWIYWGLPGLLTFLALLYVLWRCLPNGRRRDVLALCLFGLTLALLIRLSFSHVFFVKDFAAVTGLLAGGHLWIWPSHATRTSVRVFHQVPRSTARQSLS